MRSYEEMAARAPAAQEELYGKRLASLQEGARRTAARGIPPEKVGRGDRATRSPPGGPGRGDGSGIDAQGQVLLRRLLPDRALDRLLAAFLRV